MLAMFETRAMRRRPLYSILIGLATAAAVWRGVAVALDPTLLAGVSFALATSVLALAVWAYFGD